MLSERFVRPRRRSGYTPYIYSALSGILLIFVFPTFDFWPLAWVALAPFLASLRQLSPGRAFKAGMLMGLPYFFGTQYWIYHSMYYYGGVPLLPSLLSVALLSLYLSLFTGLFGALFSNSVRTTSLPAVLLAPIFWVVAEYLRAYLFTGFPWSSLGYSQYTVLPIIQFADITGVYGVSALVVAVNGAIADVFIIRQRRKIMPLYNLWPTVAGYAALAVLLVAVLVYGQVRLNQDRPGRILKVAVAQGNIRQDLKWDARYRRDVINTYKALTRKSLSGNPELVVWPETSAPFYWERDEDLTEEIQKFARDSGIYLLLGAITVGEGDSLGNSAVLIDKSGRDTMRYDKIHLVPFGEYVPLKSVLGFINRFVEGVGNYMPGQKYSHGKTENSNLSALICYEMIFPGLVRKFFKQGKSDLIVNITNDAWFGTTNGPYQHFSMSVLRAVENRKPVVRAANSGISGFIDSNGRITGRLGLAKRGIISQKITTDRTRTFYSRFGDLFAYLCIIATVLLLANTTRRV